MIKLKRLYISIVIFVITIILIRLIGWLTNFSDTFYSVLNIFFGKILYSVSSLFPFSLGDVFYSLLVVAGFVFLVYIVRLLFLKNWATFRKQISYLFYFLTVMFLTFHLFWGFNYYKTPLKESYNTENIHLEDLKKLAEIYLVKSIESRNKVKENTEGIFEFELSQSQIDSLIFKSSQKIQKKFPELKFTNHTLPNIKPSQYSTMFSYMGVLGYYNPFTNEGQYNNKMPYTKMLFTQMHETAHQWGFAPENEANFIGFLIGSESDHIDFNYVSNYMALRQVLNRIVWEDPKYVEQLIESYSPAMRRDRVYEIEIQLKYNHSVDDAFSMLNEAYLRLNNQDGLESYGKFVELLVGYHRKYPTHKE